MRIRALHTASILPKSRPRMCSAPLLSLQAFTGLSNTPSFDLVATMEGRKINVFLAHWENARTCQNSFSLHLPLYLILAVEAGGSSSLSRSTSCHYKYCEMVMQGRPKFGKALKNCRVCTHMFNPWKKNQLGRKRMTWSLSMIWAPD